MHPAELARHGLGHAPTTPVRVQGFRRSFCQEPSWRPATSLERGVLTVQRDTRGWINGLLLHGFDAPALADLDHRERGYARTAIPLNAIRPYAADSTVGSSAEPVIYLGRDEKFNQDILPSEEYLQICISGAAAHGDGFLRDFLRTTFVCNRVPLLDHRPELAPVEDRQPS